MTGGCGFTRVYDTVGALEDAFVAACRFGHVASSLSWGTHGLTPLSFSAATYSGVFTLLPLLTGEGCAHHGAILAEAARLAKVGAMLPILDLHRFALNTADDTYRMIADATTRGKLSIEIEPGAHP